MCSLKACFFLARTFLKLLSNCCSIWCNSLAVHDPKSSSSSCLFKISRSSIFFTMSADSAFNCCIFSSLSFWLV
uniref:MADS-box protein SOC1 isoform X1 n=1 Tax=Rhizophora mucronata TaxID=61149 RepID=A0A2P2LB14_RHIMU